MDSIGVLTDLLEMDRMKGRLKDESDKDIDSDGSGMDSLSSEREE